MKVFFQEVSVKATKHWFDESGKKRQKTKRFFQTLSHFNKNQDGTVKTQKQILVEIKAEREEWLAQ